MTVCVSSLAFFVLALPAVAAGGALGDEARRCTRYAPRLPTPGLGSPNQLDAGPIRTNLFLSYQGRRAIL